MPLLHPLVDDGAFDAEFLGQNHFVNIIVFINELFHFWKEFFFHAFLAHVIRRADRDSTATSLAVFSPVFLFI